MKISITSTPLQDWSGDVLIVGLFEEQLEKQLTQLDKHLSEPIQRVLEVENFKAKSGEISSFHLTQNGLRKIILLGLGPVIKVKLNELRKAVATGVRASLGNSGTLGIVLPWNQLSASNLELAVAEAARLSLFKDIRFRSEPEPRKSPTKIELIGPPCVSTSTLKAIDPICSGVELARELVGAPPNELTPEALANTAALIAKEKGLSLKVLEKEDCKDLGMGAYLAVSQGSDLPPKFIHLTYKPAKKAHKKIVLIGKGLTFDSGGYNLKVGAAQIDMMKFDMGGSAAVLGAASAIGEIRPKGVEVHFIVASCENMVNGSAVHPGDIVKASNGKTIEINNTDAEGRLTLADALVYASKLKPDAIVDLATLTGACVIALGEEVAGLWTGNDELAKDLINAGELAGEGLWRMPLHHSYKDGLKSLLADIKNTGPRQGGSITAALFLQEFVEESINWAHIDIAGTVWADKDRGLDPAGATGYGVRTLLYWICKEDFLEQEK